MTVYIALLRAVNVGTAGKLEMSALRACCEGAGFTDAKTYIQSGNVVFRAKDGEATVRAKLAAALEEETGRKVDVLVRKATELEALLAANPFADKPPSFVVVLFLDEPPSQASLNDVKTPGDEQVHGHGREVFVYFPTGQGKSKLRGPLFKEGTGRNINTVTKLLTMAHALEE